MHKAIGEENSHQTIAPSQTSRETCNFIRCSPTKMQLGGQTLRTPLNKRPARGLAAGADLGIAIRDRIPGPPGRDPAGGPQESPGRLTRFPSPRELTPGTPYGRQWEVVEARNPKTPRACRRLRSEPPPRRRSPVPKQPLARPGLGHVREPSQLQSPAAGARAPLLPAPRAACDRGPRGARPERHGAEGRPRPAEGNKAANALPAPRQGGPLYASFSPVTRNCLPAGSQSHAAGTRTATAATRLPSAAGWPKARKDGSRPDSPCGAVGVATAGLWAPARRRGHARQPGSQGRGSPAPTRWGLA